MANNITHATPLCNQKMYEIGEILMTTYPVHNQEKIIQNLRNARRISIITVNDGFYCLKLKPESYKYTAFVVEGKQYEFTRMPYGLKGALETYCQFSDQIKLLLVERITKTYPNLKDIDSKIFPCLEDWIIITETSEEHGILLKSLLDILRENELNIDPNLSQIAKESVNYNGLIIDYHGIHVWQESIERIINYPRPKNLKNVKRFNSLVQRYHNHLENISIIQEPLNKFFAKNAVWKWTYEEEVAFETTKQAVSNASSLSMIDPNLLFRLYIHEHSNGCGAKLVQYDDQNDCEKLITYKSKVFNKKEKAYPMLDKQILSIIWALFKVKYLTENRKCEVFTNSSVVTWYTSKKMKYERLEKWATMLSEYNIILKSHN